MSKSPALVLFDIDGTLIRGAGPYHKQALIDGIRTVTGIETHLDGVATAGMLDQDLISAMLRTAGVSERRIRASLGKIVAESQRCYLANCPLDLAAFVCPGVLEFVSRLHNRGAALGLVTGNLSAIGWMKVDSAGLRPYFSFGAFAEDGSTRARLAQVAAGRAVKHKLAAKKSRVTLIGDHLNDIAAAKANGFQSIGVATGVLPLNELREAQPDFLVHTLAELDPEVVF